MTFPAKLERLMSAQTKGIIGKRDVGAFLHNHADAILELVRAADEVVRISDRKHDAWDAYKVARAKLNGGKG